MVCMLWVLILKIRHPAVTNVFEVYCIVRDGRSDFKCE